MGLTQIYGLCASDGRIRYVGKTKCGLGRRLDQHKTAARAGGDLPVYRWIRKHHEDVVIFELESAGENWRERERFWIEWCRGLGDCLNLVNGGEGWPNGKPFSPEHCKNLSLANQKGRWRPCDVCGKPVWVRPYQDAKGWGRLCGRQCHGVRDQQKPPLPCTWDTSKGVEAARQKRLAITHCPQGHPYSGENLQQTSAQRRVCRTCQREHSRNYRLRKLGRLDHTVKGG